MTERVFWGNSADRQCLQSKPLLIVISGPSGVGKDALLAHMRQLNRPFHYVITYTTRPKRAEEKDGVDYIYCDVERYHNMVRQQELLEYAQVYGHWYGVPHSEIRYAVEKGLNAIVKVDIQGAATIKRIRTDAVLIFLAPSSPDELIQRLNQRDSESADQIRLRLLKVQEEMNRLSIFDYVIINRDGCLDVTVATLDAIITAEKCRISRLMQLQHNDFCEGI